MDGNSVRPSSSSEGVTKMGLSSRTAATAKPTPTARLPTLNDARAPGVAVAAGEVAMVGTMALTPAQAKLRWDRAPKAGCE